MADANIVIDASNIFGLPAAFKTSKSSTSIPLTSSAVNDEKGNVACQKNVADITSYTQTASYCGTNFISDLATFLTKFGDVQNSKLITAISISMKAAGYAVIEVTGHNHAANAHVAGLPVGYCDVSDFLPHEATEPFVAWNGYGVPSFGIALGTAPNIVSPASATVNFTMDHKDAIGEGGSHLVGKNITPRCELSMSFVGVPVANTPALLEASFAALTNHMLSPLVDSVDINDDNAEYDTFAFTAHANPVLATA